LLSTVKSAKALPNAVLPYRNYAKGHLFFLQQKPLDKTGKGVSNTFYPTSYLFKEFLLRQPM